MNLKSKTLIAVVAVLCIDPLTYAGRGPDDIQFSRRILKMDKLIEQADSTKTPAERKHLLEQHMQEMHACMDMMKDGNMGMGMSNGTTNAPMDSRQMEQRMEMMQMMMDQMMKQQDQSMKMMK